MRKKREKFITALLVLSMLLLSSKQITVMADATVYVTETGDHYHSTSSCRGLNRARNVYETTLSNAQARGLTPCSLCCGGSYTPSNTVTQETQSTASTPIETAQPTVPIQEDQQDPTVSLNRFIRITGVKKAEDGSWISLRLKNVSGKRIAVMNYIAIEDKKNVGFAWYQPKFDPIRWLGKGKQKEYKFVAYQFNNPNNPKPKMKLEPNTFNRGQIGYVLAFGYGEDSYIYFCNPSKKMKKCIKYDDNTNDIYKKYFTKWLNVK